MMPVSALFALVAGVGAGSGPPLIDIRVELVEGVSITEAEPGEVTYIEDLTVPSGGRCLYEYTDPLSDHEYRVTVELTRPDGASKKGDLTVARVEVEDLTLGKVTFVKDNLAIDGRMFLTLHPVPETDRSLFLSLRPRIRRGDS